MKRNAITWGLLDDLLEDSIDKIHKNRLYIVLMHVVLI